MVGFIVYNNPKAFLFHNPKNTDDVILKRVLGYAFVGLSLSNSFGKLFF